MAFTVNNKAFYVLEFAKTESTVTVQRRFQIMYHTEPPTDKTIREWYMNSSRVAACVLRNKQAVRAHRPRRPVLTSCQCKKILHIFSKTSNNSKIKAHYALYCNIIRRTTRKAKEMHYIELLVFIYQQLGT